MDQAPRNDPDMVEALRVLSVKPGQSSNPTALRSIVGWALVESRADVTEALYSGMTQVIAQGEMGHGSQGKMPRTTQGEETLDGDGSSFTSSR